MDMDVALHDVKRQDIYDKILENLFEVAKKTTNKQVQDLLS